MSEQWFLDLDGVRSGPYQTSEVMSLVAEGEILPHHQIATDLKSQKWMTILEWRLNQNRNTETKKDQVSPAASVSPAQEKPIPVEVLAPIESSVAIEIPPPALKTPKTPPPKKAPTDGTKSKRDPIAEMFDMLQNTKQKRESKSQQTHAAQDQAQTQTTHTHANATAGHTLSTYTSSKSALGKTIIIGLIITVVGFALGQFFQRQSQKPAEIAAQPVVNVTATPTPSLSPFKTTDETGREVLEARTDKMVIRVPVNKEKDSAATNPSPEHGKDIQELKDLKRELQELKALKEEIRGNPNTENEGNGRLIPPNPNNVKNIENFDSEVGDGSDGNGNPAIPEENTHY